MARPESLDAKLDIGADTVDIVTLSPISEGAEGRIEVADGQRKYRIRDQIRAIPEFEFAFYMKRDRIDYNIVKDYSSSASADDIFLRLVDAEDNTIFTYALENCEITMGERSAYDRNSKSPDMHTAFLLPENVELEE